MLLSNLLSQITTRLKVRNGDPYDLEIWRVNEYGPQHPADIPGGLYLVPSRELLDAALHQIQHDSKVAFLVQEDLYNNVIEALPVMAKATILTITGRIPLDLSSQIQQILDNESRDSLASDTVSRARQDLVEDIVFQRYRDEKTILTRARALGLTLQRVCAVLLIGFDDFEGFYLRNEDKGELFFHQTKGKVLILTRRMLADTDPWSILTPHGEGAVALLSVDVTAMGTRLATYLRQELRGIPLVVTAGNTVSTLSGLALSYQEALSAQRLRTKLRLRQSYLHFSEVSSYALLQRIEKTPEIVSILNRELASLIEIDKQHKSRLVETLAAYLDAGSSLKLAAEQLKVHPKTLRYRLDRIREVMGADVFKSDKRLLVYLAAKYHLWLAL